MIKDVFYGVMLGIFNSQKCIQKELHRMKKSLLMILIMMGLSFLCEKKILERLKQKTKFALMSFVIKISWFFQYPSQLKNLKIRRIFLLVIGENKSNYAYIKDFDRFMFHKTQNENKKYFCNRFLQCFSSKNVLTERKEVCLSINGAQPIRLEKAATEFKSCIKITFLEVLLTSLFG